MIGDVLIREALIIRLEDKITLERLEVRDDLARPHDHVIVLHKDHLKLDRVYVVQLDPGEAKAAKCFEHEGGDKVGNVLASGGNRLCKHPLGDRVKNCHELKMSRESLSETEGLTIVLLPD